MPIVPVKLGGDVGEEWRPSGWLGIVVAGSLWTWLGEDCSQSDVDNIVGQIKLAVPGWSNEAAWDGSADGGRDEVDASGDFSVQELREELERLKLEIGASSSVVAAGTRDDGGLCPLPAGVQTLPPGMRVSTKMQKLVKQLLSSHSKRRIGFHGESTALHAFL